MSDDSLIDANRRAVPAVGRRALPLALPLGVTGVVLLGAATFAALYHPADTAVGTDALIISRAPSSSTELPAPPVLAPIATPVVAVPVIVPAYVPPVAAVQPKLQAVSPPPRSVTPALIVDLSPAAKTADTTAVGKTDGAAVKLNSNEAFVDRVSRIKAETVSTEQLASTSMVIPQGTIIAGVLETAINSDLPGLVRAVVSRDVPGFDGTTVLIPRGSRLIGQYSNGVALGQSRAFVIWTRMLRSDGVSVQLGSAGTDALGTAGLAGKVDSHFLRRFGAAALLSVVTAGLEFLTNSTRSGSTVIVGSSGQANQLAGIALQRDVDIPPTIKVPQGTPIRVFVAKDMDFSVAGRTSPSKAARP